jgi:hypothetical protein
VSRWADGAVAQKFADIYRESLKKRYRSIRLVNLNGSKTAQGSQPSARQRAWLTEDGDVVIDVAGPTVFITESIDDVTSANLRDAVLSRSAVSESKALQGEVPPELWSSVSALINALPISAAPSASAKIGRRLPSP